MERAEGRGMRTTVAILVAVAACWLAHPAAARGQESDDWASGFLDADDADSAREDTGIVGMTREELAEYTRAEADEVDEEVPDDFIRQRRRFVMREMKINSDWDCDPTAVPALIDQLKRRTGMDAQALQPRQPLTFDDPEILHWPFLYVTSHYAFTFSEAEAKGLRLFCDRGGFFYADDCLYGNPFGQAFPGEVRKAYPGKEFQTLDPKHPVFGIVLRQKYTWAHTNEAGYPSAITPNPYCYFQVDGHIGVLYSPGDFGCSWEISSPPTDANPLGGGMHSGRPEVREACYRLGINIILYALIH